MSIQFQEMRSGDCSVKLDGRVVGHIRLTLGGGWFYAPKGASPGSYGPVMATKALVKASLK